ncbi:MAG: translation elongation factor Ts [Gammaproteobacteria bacterium]|nr:translation elongation factor Ts [Gammaproteobacteria bacterium]MDX2488324.1 translation elongation factor Ts [Gammaproteobacteria bacterium]
MAITASMVKELRERTSAGMMECKKALSESDGDMEAAVQLLRTSGAAKADKKAGRVAAEGVVSIYISDDKKLGVIVEVNSETDFVAKGDDFQNFAADIAAVVAATNPADLDALNATKLASGETVDETRRALIAKLGENITVRRFERVEASGDAEISSYQHGLKIGVLVNSTGGNDNLGKDLAMHVAALKPMCVSTDEVPADAVEKEKEVFSAQAAESGKPPEIIEKMITGRINKFLNEVALHGQDFVKDPATSIGKLLKAENATVVAFTRVEVGEGIEKKVEDFAAEVAAQAKGA